MKAINVSKRVLVFCAVFAALPMTALPARADFLGKFDAWEAHARSDGGAKVCYAATVPVKSVGDYSKRGDVFFLVSHRPADKMIGFVSLEAGYPYGTSSKITATIGDKTYPLFPDGGLAFAYDDKPLIDGMIRGVDMVLQGTSSRGTLTTDTFSLKGFTAAYQAASKACGVKG